MQKFIEPYLVLDCIETLCSLQTTRFGNWHAIFFPRAARSKTAKMHGYLIMLNLRSGDAVLLPFFWDPVVSVCFIQLTRLPAVTECPAKSLFTRARGPLFRSV